MRSILVPALCLLGLVGCSPPEASDESAAGLTLDHRSYVLAIESHETGQDRRSGNTSEAVTRLLSTATVKSQEALADGTTQVTFTVQPCRTVLPGALGLSPIIDDAILQNHGSLEVRAILTPDGKLTSDKSAVVLGAELDDPINDALPETGDDPRVMDEDGDGHPGISIGVSIFHVYVASRVTVALTGDLQSGGELAGTSDFKVEQQVYGDSVPFIDVRSKLQDLIDNTDIISREAHFRVVPQSKVSCDKAIALDPDVSF